MISWTWCIYSSLLFLLPKDLIDISFLCFQITFPWPTEILHFLKRQCIFHVLHKWAIFKLTIVCITNAKIDKVFFCCKKRLKYHPFSYLHAIKHSIWHDLNYDIFPKRERDPFFQSSHFFSFFFLILPNLIDWSWRIACKVNLTFYSYFIC